MNVNLSKDDFHETIMLYLIDIAKDNRSLLLEGEQIVFTEEFDDFLRHIIQRPLGSLKMVYYREPSNIKLAFKRMNKKMKSEQTDSVRLII